MSEIKLLPASGINNAAEDEALFVFGDEPKLFLREALNVNISRMGRVDLMSQPMPIAVNDDVALSDLWQSPLHKDVFARRGSHLVKVDTKQELWATEELAEVGKAKLHYCLLNNTVCISGANGIFVYDGMKVEPITIDTPPKPMVANQEDGSLSGMIGVAVSWLRGAKESALSEVVFTDCNGYLQVTMPVCADTSITGAKLYATTENGGQLLLFETVSAQARQVVIKSVRKLGVPAKFKNLSPMISGDYLSYWKGRLIVAKSNVLHFSEAMAYHLYDERHGFVQMPQRITFVVPVEGGLWVGQIDHVVFLRGSSPDGLTVEHKYTQSPVKDSGILIDAESVNGELSQGGHACALWLASNGFVIGTAEGQAIEIHKGTIQGIEANSGNSVVLAQRAYAAIT